MIKTDGAMRLIDIKAAAGYTGVSVHTLYAMVSQRRIPFVKVGRC
jgi:excisionase family DNA binding protein